MQMPAILQGRSLTRLLQGVAVGAALTVILGFNFAFGYGFGWTTGGKANERVAAALQEGKMAILAPICASEFAAKEGALEKYKATQSYNRDTIVRDSLKTVSDVTMDYALARACVTAIDKNLSKSAEKKS